MADRSLVSFALLDEDLILSSQQGSADNRKTLAYTVKLAYRNNYILATEGIHGGHKYIGLLRDTVLTPGTFSSNSAFRAQLLNVFFFQNMGSLRKKMKLGNSAVFLMRVGEV